MRITGTKTVGAAFDARIDWIEFRVTAADNYRLEISNTFTLDSSNPAGFEIQVRYNVTENSENWFLKAYNWTASAFSNIGFNFTGGSQPTAQEWNLYAISVTNDWADYVDENNVVHVQFCDEGSAVGQITVEVDFFGVRVVTAEASMEIKNSSPRGIHIVAIWVTNSTVHTRGEADLFLNSGETARYPLALPLPQGTFVAKAVTERGNVAVFAGD